MDKKHVIRFLKERKRGAYPLLVKMYAGIVGSMSIRLALDLIKEDLEKESSESVDLHYFSFAKAISRFKKKTGTIPVEEYEFHDEYENKKVQPGLGEFDI